MANEQHTDNSLLSFPCDFPIKVFGPNKPHFGEEMLAIVKQHYPNIKADDLVFKPSRNDNYLSLTINLIAHSKQQLDAIYQALNDSPATLMVL